MQRRSDCKLRGDATAPATVRRLVHSSLSAAGHPASIATAQLLASEIVTNAVIHTTCAECTVHIDTDDAAVRIEVVDCDPAHLPELLPLDPERFGGIGLHIVNDVARCWGCHVGEADKTVWFELADATHRDG